MNKRRDRSRGAGGMCMEGFSKRLRWWFAWVACLCRLGPPHYRQGPPTHRGHSGHGPAAPEPATRRRLQDVFELGVRSGLFYSIWIQSFLVQL